MGVGRVVCPRCLRSVMLLRTPTGGRIAVDPTPREGGALIVNGASGRVIGRYPKRGPDSRYPDGWWEHGDVCPQPLQVGLRVRELAGALGQPSTSIASA